MHANKNNNYNLDIAHAKMREIHAFVL